MSKQISDEDEISRFIVRTKDIKPSNQTIRYTAFMPYIPKNKETWELSLFHTEGLSAKAVWNGPAKILKKTPKGRGILAAKDFLEHKLRLISTPASHPKHHDAVEWPEEKERQILIAQKLSQNAILEKNP